MHLVTGNTDDLDDLKMEDLIGKRIAVLGISGSGKTNTVAVLVEEMLAQGLPVTIVDIEGEYYGLKERFPLLVAGRSEQAEVPLLVENAAALASISMQRGISVILDLSEYDQEEMQAILLAYFEALWKQSTALKSPYEVVIEEAHEFVPQGTKSPLKTLLTRFALRGRKRGVGVILASQRSAKVEKDVLTQANILFLQNVIHPTDLNVYKDLVPLPAKEVEQQARELVPGEAFVVRGKQIDRVHIRRQHTFHAGDTPELGTVPPHLKTIDATLLEELRAVTSRVVTEEGNDELARVKKQLKSAQDLIAEQQATIARLSERVEVLSKLTVQGPANLEIEQASVNHLHANVAAPVPSSSSMRVVEAAVPQKEMAPPLNEAKLATLKHRLAQVPILELAMLRVLIQQGKALTTQQMAAWLNRPESTIQNNPPRTLLKLQLISRARGRNGYLYQAKLTDYLQREFPGVEMEPLVAQVVHSLQQ